MGANPLHPFMPLQWIQMGHFATLQWAVARSRYIRVAAKQHLKLEQYPPYQDLLVCLGEEIRSMGKQVLERLEW